MEKQESKSIQEPKETDQSKLTCGIIMPISSIDNCTKEHWVEVKKIIFEAIQAANFTPSLVSDADDSGVIQKRIVQNIYDNDIVVCDVSCKNPNVMFELGMRLAFDKPTIIVMDDNTNYSFDTSVIEHLSYPRNLSYYQILDFQKKLSNKITATFSKAKDDPNYTTFLKHFGEFDVAHIEKKKGTLDEAILSKLNDLSIQITSIQRQRLSTQPPIPSQKEKEIQALALRDALRTEIERFCSVNGIKDEYVILDNERLFNALLNNVLKSPKVMSITSDFSIIQNILRDTIHPF